MKRVYTLIIFQLSSINCCSQSQDRLPGDFAFLGMRMTRANGDTFMKQFTAISLIKNCDHMVALSFDREIFLKSDGTANTPAVFTSASLYLLPGQKKDTVALFNKWIIGAEFMVEEQDSLTMVLLTAMNSTKKVVDELYSTACIDNDCDYCKRPGPRGSHLILRFAKTSVKTGP